MLAMNQICDRFPKEAPSTIKRLLPPEIQLHTNPAGSRRARSHVHGLWSLERLGALNDRSLKDSLESPLAIGRVHALRILAERGIQAALRPDAKAAGSGLKPALRRPVLAALSDPDALVQRCAAEALGAWPAFENIRPLLGLRHRVERAAGILPAGSAGETRAAGASDTHLDYVVRKALRDQIKADGVLTRLRGENLSEQDARAIADVAVAVPSAEAGEFLLRHVQRYSEKQETLVNYLRLAARYAPEKDLDWLASFTRNKFADELDFQLALFKSIQQGTEQRGATLSGGRPAL